MIHRHCGFAAWQWLQEVALPRDNDYRKWLCHVAVTTGNGFATCQWLQEVALPRGNDNTGSGFVTWQWLQEVALPRGSDYRKWLCHVAMTTGSGSATWRHWNWICRVTSSPDVNIVFAPALPNVGFRGRGFSTWHYIYWKWSAVEKHLKSCCY